MHDGRPASGADYLPAFNGRGDVCQLINASDGSLAARYEYDPFGKLIALGGAYADANPFRFSTKIADAVTGYSYFGYRDYHPHLGRWLNRDPIAEAGGLNVYAYVGNAVADLVDWLGLDPTLRYPRGNGWDLLSPALQKAITGRFGSDAWVTLSLRGDGSKHFLIHDYDSNGMFKQTIDLGTKVNRSDVDKTEALADFLDACRPDTTPVGEATRATGVALKTAIGTAVPVVGAADDIHEAVTNPSVSTIGFALLSVIPILSAVDDIGRLDRALGKADDLVEDSESALKSARKAAKAEKPGPVKACITAEGRAGGAGAGGCGTSSAVDRAIATLNQYPQVIDPRTGRHIPFPSDIGDIVPRADRVAWGAQERSEFIAEWYRRGYETPRGGWEHYDIHHIKPREYGGSNDFWNLVPVERTTHQGALNSYWREYGSP